MELVYILMLVGLVFTSSTTIYFIYINYKRENHYNQVKDLLLEIVVVAEASDGITGYYQGDEIALWSHFYFHNKAKEVLKEEIIAREEILTNRYEYICSSVQTTTRYSGSPMPEGMHNKPESSLSSLKQRGIFVSTLKADETKGTYGNGGVSDVATTPFDIPAPFGVIDEDNKVKPANQVAQEDGVQSKSTVSSSRNIDELKIFDDEGFSKYTNPDIEYFGVEAKENTNPDIEYAGVETKENTNDLGEIDLSFMPITSSRRVKQDSIAVG